MKPFLLIILLLCAIPLIAGSEDVNLTTDPVRTHPCYQANNWWYGDMPAPISLDGDYFWVYEEAAFTYPADGPLAECAGRAVEDRNGRGLVYGPVSALKPPGSELAIAAYDALVKPLPTLNCTVVTSSGISPLYWDKTTNGKLYGNCEDGTIRSITVTDPTPAWSAAICDWSDISKSGSDTTTVMYGWSNDHPTWLVGTYGGPFWTNPLKGPAGSIACDVATGSEYYQAIEDPEFPEKKIIANFAPYLVGCDVDHPDDLANCWFLDTIKADGNGHQVTPFDTRNYVAFLDRAADNRVDRYNTDYKHAALGNPFSKESGYINHGSWLNDADWFIVDIFNDATIEDKPGLYSAAGIGQVYYDRTGDTAISESRKIKDRTGATFTISTAKVWKDDGVIMNWNLCLLPSLNINKDGKPNRIAWTATNNKYTYDDYVEDTTTFTAATTDILTLGAAKANLLVANTAVRVSTTDTLPAGLAASTTYYVRAIDGSTCKLSTTQSDVGIVDITDTGTGTHSIKPANWEPIGMYVANVRIGSTVPGEATRSLLGVGQ